MRSRGPDFTDSGRPNHEVAATWVAATLLGVFLGVYLAAVFLAWSAPQAPQSTALQQLLMALVPLVTLAVQWYLRQRGRGGPK